MAAVLKQFMAGQGTAFEELRMDCKKNKMAVSKHKEYEAFKTAAKKKNLRLPQKISDNISIRSRSQLEQHMLDDPDGEWTVFKLGEAHGKKPHFAIAQTDTTPDHKWFFDVKDARIHFQSNRFTGDEIRLSKGIFSKCLPGNESGILSRIIESMWKSPTWLVATGVRYKPIKFKFKPTHLENKFLKWKSGGDIEVDAVVASQARDEVLIVEGKRKGKEVFKGQIAFSYKAVLQTLLTNNKRKPLPKITPIIVVAGNKYAYICWCDWKHDSAITEMKIDKVYRAKL